MKFSKLNKYMATAGMLALLIVPSAATAAVINNMISVPGINEFQDSDAERILRFDSEGNQTVVTTGAYQVGDVIQTILRFDTANGVNIGDVNPAPYQLIGYSELLITAVNPGIAPNTVELIFGATGNLGAGVMVELFERTSVADPGLLFSDAPGTSISNVLANTLIAELGFGDADDFWQAISVDDIGVLATAAPGSGQAAGGEFGISILSNPGLLPIATNGILSPVSGNMHDVVGDLSVYAREIGVNAGWLLSSNINASFNTVEVPEPSVLAILALGLVGMGFTIRRREIY